MWVNVKQVNNTRYMTYIYKGIIVALLLFVAMMDCHAQLPEKGDWKTRVGVKAPSMIEALTMKVLDNPPHATSTRILTCKDYLDYYESFKKLTDYAPYAHYHFYSGAFSEERRSDLGDRTIYECILDSITDEAIRVVIIDDFLALGRNIYEHLDSINIVRANGKKGGLKSDSDTLSLPVAMTKYAHLYYKYAGNPKYYPAHLYDKVQARENYRKAFRMLVDNNIDPGEELEAVYLNEYYGVCEDVYKTDVEKYYDQFLQDYLDIVQVCDNLLIPYYNIPEEEKNDENNPLYEKYRAYNYWTEHPEFGIKALFQSSGAAESERLSSYYLAKLGTYRRDSVYLNRALNILNKNNCTQTEAFYSYSEALYAIMPTYLSCIGCALASKEYNMRDDMIKYFTEAYDLANSDMQRGLIAYQIGMEMNTPIPTEDIKSPEYTSWEDNMHTAYSNLKKVLLAEREFANSSAIAIREIPARTRFALAQNLYRLRYSSNSIAEMNEAAGYVRDAMQQAPKLFSAGPGLLKNIESRISKLKNDARDRRRDEAQQKAYNEYLRKKKAEEDFWNQR